MYSFFKEEKKCGQGVFFSFPVLVLKEAFVKASCIGVCASTKGRN